MLKRKLFLCVAILSITSAFPCIGNAMTVSSSTSTLQKEIEISQNINENIEAYLITPDGEKLELEIVDIDVAQVPTNTKYKSNSDDITTYAATVKTKTGSGGLNKYGIVAASSLTMTWVDGKGTDNKITNLTGYYTIAKGTLKYGELYWGSTYVTPSEAPNSKIVGETFDEDVDYTSTDNFDGTLRADSIAFITSPEDGRGYQMTVKVSPSIFS